ncbi:Phosphoribosylformylglycinamidine synthase 1 [compost metagenome]
MKAALTKIGGEKPAVVWHQDTDIPEADLIVIPGGFSYGDYLRCGAIAARSPRMTCREWMLPTRCWRWSAGTSAPRAAGSMSNMIR